MATLKRLGLYALSIVLLLYMGSLLGCRNDDCGFKEEPTLFLEFRQDVQFTLVYGLKENIEPIESSESNFYELPVDLSQQSTIYIFENMAGADTLEVLYDVDVGYQSRWCGFTARLIDLRKGSKTTFDSVTFQNRSIVIE